MEAEQPETGFISHHDSTFEQELHALGKERDELSRTGIKDQVLYLRTYPRHFAYWRTLSPTDMEFMCAVMQLAIPSQMMFYSDRESVATLAAMLKKHRNTIVQAITRVRKRGYLERKAKGKYLVSKKFGSFGRY